MYQFLRCMKSNLFAVFTSWNFFFLRMRNKKSLKIHLHLLNEMKGKLISNKKNNSIQVPWRWTRQFIKLHVADCDHILECGLWRYRTEHLLWTGNRCQYRYYGELNIQFQWKHCKQPSENVKRHRRKHFFSQLSGFWIFKINFAFFLPRVLDAQLFSLRFCRENWSWQEQKNTFTISWWILS